MTIQLLHGNCLDQLKTLPDNSVDSVVTDPPYGLSQHTQQQVLDCLTAWIAGEEYKPSGKGFMGKEWDAWVPGPEIFRECLRVLKPGGHILAFAGTRSMDLMSMSIRLAGFELRDAIGHAHDGGGAPLAAWAYGSGFPKSLNVSKQLDKLDSDDTRRERAQKFVEWMQTTGITQPQLRDSFHNSAVFKTKETCSTRASEYLGHAKQKAVIAPVHAFEHIRSLISVDIPDWIEELVKWREIESENYKRREVVGIQKGAISNWRDDGTTKTVDREISLPFTSQAKQWDGWGTALKPAWEPIIMARKPLEGTVADNVMKYGTGGLNIDGCRVGETGARNNGNSNGTVGSNSIGVYGKAVKMDYGKGRFPANLIHDGSDEVMASFPDTGSKSKTNPNFNQTYSLNQNNKIFGGGMGGGSHPGFEDTSSSSSRFFYCAKASTKDRDEGLDGFDVKRTGGMQATADGSMLTGSGNERTTARSNTHPTVKPTELMRYLCRLVTPPGGTVLDPFMGSGSTGKGAVMEGFNFIGCEMSQEYLDIARARIQFAVDKVEEEAKKEEENNGKPTLF